MKFGFYTAIARRIFLPCILCIPWSLPVLGQAEALPDFEREVKPVLAKRCYGCHGAEKQRGKLRLDTMSTDLLKDPRSAELWHEVRAVINLGEMPPEDEPKLTVEERRVILDWLNPTIERAVKSRQSKGGRVVALGSYQLPGKFHRNPADRILVSTARAHGLTLVTADRRILRYRGVKTIDARR